MKTLILVRHAKSDWDNPELSDFDRTLNKRGMSDAPEMAARFLLNGVKPELLISSSAVRAFTTCEFFAKALNIDVNKIQLEQKLYEASSREAMDIISQVDDTVNTLMVFGHNPTISSLATYLSSIQFGDMPTCAFVCISFSTNHWKDILKKTGELKFYDYPKKSS